MKQQKFESQFRPEWETFGEYLDNREGTILNRNQNPDRSLADFPKQYRRMCHFLSIAKERKYSYFLVDQLNSLVLRGHQHLYTTRKRKLSYVIKFFTYEFPNLIRKEWKLVCLALALFYLSGAIMASLTYVFPELIHSVFSQQQINQFEDMYDPAKRKLGRTRDADTDIYMFGYYIAHNTGISFQTFAGGVLLGLGTVFYLVYNGIFMGAVTVHLAKMGFGSTFFPFVVGHGSFELTAIIISGAAGLKLGFSIIAPGRQRRANALKRAAQVSVKMVFGVIIMLLIAAFLEAFWSSSTFFTSQHKYIVGAVLWGLVLIYFLFSGKYHGSGKN